VSAVSSSAFIDPRKLEWRLNDLNTHLTQAVTSLGAAIGLQSFSATTAVASKLDTLIAASKGGGGAGATAAAAASQVKALAAASASQAGAINSKIDALTEAVERLSQAVAHDHEASSPAVSLELQWLKTAAAAGASNPHSSMVAYALKNSQDLLAELESRALAKLLSRGLSAAANSLVLKAPIVLLSDLAEWSPEGATIVGAGTYGQVRPGVLSEVGLPVAVKTLPMDVVAQARKSGEAALSHLVKAMRREADIR